MSLLVATAGGGGSQTAMPAPVARLQRQVRQVDDATGPVRDRVAQLEQRITSAGQARIQAEPEPVQLTPAAAG